MTPAARRRSPWLPGSWLLLAAAAACGRPAPVPVRTGAIVVPARAPTAGDGLLALAPAGADVVIELDAARLRANPVVGGVVDKLAAWSAGGPEGMAVLQRADAILLCAYDVGGNGAAALTLVRVEDPGAWGTVVGEGVAVLGEPEWVSRVVAVSQGREEGLVGDRELMAVRARAMPAAAEGAWLRVAARLDFDARVALASRFDLDAVPREMSVWADVADDLAVVVWAEGASASEAGELAAAMRGWRDRLSTWPWVRRQYLHFLLASIEFAVHGGAARAVLVIAPRRLQRMMTRLSRALDREQ